MLFNEDQLALKDSIRRMVEKEVLPLAAEIDDTDRFPVEWRKTFGELGLLQMWVPEEDGGAGCDLTRVCIAKEETGKASLTASTLCCNNSIGLILPLLNFGTEEQKQKWLPRSGRGELVTAVAMTEPGTGSDVSSIKTRAVQRASGEWVLNGQKSWITWAAVADVILVFAKTGDGPSHDSISCFLVETHLPGFRLGRAERKMGRNGAPNHEIFFDDMVLPPDALIGQEGKGFSACMKILDLNRPTIAASSLGVAQGAFDLCVQWCKERKVYGKTIGQFQGMQFKLADMAMKLEAARQMLYGICAEIDSGDHSRLQMIASMSKCYVTDVAMDITVEAVQIFGAAGYSKDYPLERMMRDAKVNQIIEGTNEIHRMIIGRTLTR